MSVLSTPIKPFDIKSSPDLGGYFGLYEAERVAADIVNICQGQGDWLPVPLARLQRKSGEFYPRGLKFLVEKGFASVRDGALHLSVPFVNKCHQAAPARR